MDDFSELKSDVKELLQRSAVHNALLAEHKNFSIALQNEHRLIRTELVPIKEHIHLVGTILKIGGMILAGVVVQWFIRYFLIK